MFSWPYDKILSNPKSKKTSVHPKRSFLSDSF